MIMSDKYRENQLGRIFARMFFENMVIVKIEGNTNLDVANTISKVKHYKKFKAEVQ